MGYNLVSKVCDICGSGDVKPVWKHMADGSNIVIKQPDGSLVNDVDVMCMNCGLVYKNPTFDRESLTKFYKEEYSKLYRKSFEAGIPKDMLTYTLYVAIMALDWLSARIPLRGKKILDIGSGDGMFARCASAEGATVTLVDIDPKSRDVTMRMHGMDTIQADFSVGPAVNGIHDRFDIVCLRNVIEHMYSPSEALTAAGEYLKDGGVILIEAPSATMPYPAIPVGAFLSAAHNYTFTPSTLCNLAHKCGMSVSDIQYAGHNSCMLAIIKKCKQNYTIHNDAQDIYTYIKKRYKEHDEIYFQKESILLKLFESTNVSNNIDYINSLKHTSNVMALSYINGLPNNKDSMRVMAEVFDKYKWTVTQANDIQCCEATFEFLRGMFCREIGDFSRAAHCYKAAKFMYPRIMDRNVVKEMLIDGILSEQQFNNYFWYMNEKACQAV